MQFLIEGIQSYIADSNPQNAIEIKCEQQDLHD